MEDSRAFTAPDGSYRIDRIETWEDRGPPSVEWRVTGAGGELRLPGRWEGKPEFAADGGFALTLVLYDARVRVAVHPGRGTFTLPGGEAEPLDAFERRVRRYEAECARLWRRATWPVDGGAGSSILTGVLSLGFVAGGAWVLVTVPAERARWRIWLSTAVFALFALASFANARRVTAGHRDRDEAIAELERLRAEGP